MRRQTPLVLFVLVLVACVAMTVPVAGGGTDGTTAQATVSTATSSSPSAGPSVGALADGHVSDCAATPPDDFSDPAGETSETVGWVDGYWYNEPLDIEGELENPLTQEELNQVLRRTAARVEAIRCLTLETPPPVATTTIEEQIEQSERYYQGLPPERRNFLNAEMQTLLLVGTERDAATVQAEQEGSFGAAYYVPGDNTMLFVVENPDEIRIDESILAHELVHALQYQNIDLPPTYQRETNDGVIAGRTTTEGDASLVQELYAENCDQWAGDCLTYEAGTRNQANWGEFVNQFAPYSTSLVAETRATEGWEGVNDLLRNPPESTVEAIYPEKYGDFQRASVILSDQSNDEWERIELPYQNIDHEVLGQHGLLGMLVAPVFEGKGPQDAVDKQQFLQEHSGGPYEYDISAVDGWQGDKLFTYASDATDVPTSDTERGSVLKTAWENATDAAAFRTAYEELIGIRGGKVADGYENVYTIESQNWSMAIATEQRGDRLLIVTAPTIDDLTEIHSVDLQETSESTPNETTPTPDASETTPTETPTNQTGTPETSDSNVSTADGTGPGFGVIAGLLSIGLSTVLLRRRQA